MNENKKNSQILRSENHTLEHATKQKCNEVVKTIMELLTNLEKDFSRSIQNDKTETDFIKSQVNGLVQDKTKLEKDVISIKIRLAVCEDEVGMP